MSFSLIFDSGEKCEFHIIDNDYILYKMEEPTFNYKGWTGKHKFCCQGRLMAGPDWYKAVLTLSLFSVAQFISFYVTFVPLAM